MNSVGMKIAATWFLQPLQYAHKPSGVWLHSSPYVIWTELKPSDDIQLCCFSLCMLHTSTVWCSWFFLNFRHPVFFFAESMSLWCQRQECDITHQGSCIIVPFIESSPTYVDQKVCAVSPYWLNHLPPGQPLANQPIATQVPKCLGLLSNSPQLSSHVTKVLM